MCGIAGIFHLNSKPASTVALKKMTDAIAHRGPDGEGVYVNGAVGLGHRRLAIIDLSPLGHQPMATRDSRYVLSYNGEIYNFNELRVELEALGHGFNSKTDTEVLLHAWAEWGSSCVSKLNGMFAFAMWDNSERTLHLVRDRYGIKPLYYAVWDNTLLFGSEQKAILAHPESRKEIDKEALLEYFTFQNIFTDKTLLKNVKLLKPATILTFKQGEPNSYSHTYWDYCFREPEYKVDYRESVEELDRLLKQAVNRQLVSDVELGSYLSGGMDSGTLTALASQYLPYIKTFTCGFDLSSASGLELAFDERTKAEAMSAKFKTEHYEMVLKAGDMERCIPKLAYHLEEPRVGQSYPNYYVAQLASKFVKVVLSGAGGDELFGGYPWRYYRAVNCANFEDYIDQYYVFWQRLVDNSTLKKLFAPIWDEVKHVWTRDIFRDVFLSHDNELSGPQDYINYSLYFEAKTFLHGLLVVEDKLSMTHGLETRVPFLDNDLVDFGMRCPVAFKLKNLNDVVKIDENAIGKKNIYNFKKSNDGKQILRNVMNRYIPEEILNSEKQGFSAPDASWFKGDSIHFVANKLLYADANIYSYIDRESTHNLVREHMRGDENRRLLIWSLLSIEEFLMQF